MALLTDVSVNINNNCKQETFIGNFRQGKEFLDKIYDEHHSNNLTKNAMYRQGNLVGTLESVTKQICPSHHISSHGSPIPKKELSFNHQQPPSQKPPPPLKGAPAVEKVQSVNIFDVDDPTSVNVPDKNGNAFDHIVTNYINVLLLTNTFDTSRPCAVCDKTGHTFDNCPVLQNVDFLCKHYIQFKLFLKK